LRGTLHPHDANTELSSSNCNPKQIDGIVHDPRLGPAIIREGAFLVAHPAFCRGIIEIRTSEGDLKAFEVRLKTLYNQYFKPELLRRPSPYLNPNHVMGIVIHDADPKKHSSPDWLPTPIQHYALAGHCPIFILFRRRGDDHEPFEPGIDAMIKAMFRSGWQQASREDKLGPEMPGP